MNRLRKSLHLPFGSRCSAANPHGLCSFDHLGLEFLGMTDEVTAWVLLTAHTEECLAVARLLATDEENHIMLTRKFAKMGYAVSHLTTDGVAILESFLS